MTVVMTMFSMVAVEFIHPLNTKLGTDGCEDAFNSVYQSNLTLLQIIVAGDNFGQCTLPLMREYPSTVAFFVCVLGVIALGLMNLVLSAIVDRATQVRGDNE